jgi:molecular chaperone DnaJ
VATTKRDYYEVLGVSRDADDRAIKKAFRSLARELHPDVSEDPDAEERFRELAEAYEVLSKPETRELYDRYGHEGLRTGGFRPSAFDFGSLTDLFSAFFGDDLLGGATGTRARRRGGDVLAEVEIDLVEAARGVKRTVPLSVSVTCGTCSGSGAAPGSVPETCPQCGGAGRLQQVSNTIFGQFVRAQLCQRCNGGGKIVTQLCDDCGGAGRVTERRSLEISIPSGIHDGQRIRLSGEGHSGGAGVRAGDVYVLVRVRPDPRFVREGDHIVSTVDLTMTQAALGARVTIPTLEGDAGLDLKPGTQPGEIHVLRGKGMPVLHGFGRGDHRVLVNVTIPRRLSDEQRRLLEGFEQGADPSIYGTDEGLFARIKGIFH